MSYIYFYGHRKQHGDYACFSNWYPTKFTCDEFGKTFANVEQYMMWRKAVLFKDPKKALQIMATNNPGACKKLGRQVSGFDQTVWDENCEEIVTRGCFLKFSQNEDLKNILLSTGEATLAEASPYDRIWGIGLSVSQAQGKTEADWKGKNLLGNCLMTVREELTKE